VALLLAVVAAAAGCSDEYEHRRLDAEDARTVEVREMVRALRSAGPDDLAPLAAAQSVPDADQRQAAALRQSLEQIASAEAAELLRLDRFGEDVYRAILELREAGRERKVSLLLVPADGELRWAKRN
jgi:NAD-dependent DNA ligase